MIPCQWAPADHEAVAIVLVSFVYGRCHHQGDPVQAAPVATCVVHLEKMTTAGGQASAFTTCPECKMRWWRQVGTIQVIPDAQEADLLTEHDLLNVATLAYTSVHARAVAEAAYEEDVELQRKQGSGLPDHVTARNLGRRARMAVALRAVS